MVAEESTTTAVLAERPALRPSGGPEGPGDPGGSRDSGDSEGQSAASESPNGIELSIIVPAFNEARRLAPSLESMLAYLEASELSFEILVVDDGSGDATFEVAKSFWVRGVEAHRLARNQGKGAALRHGVLRSRGRKVLLIDADSSIPIDQLDRLLPTLDDVPLAIASRTAPGAVAEHLRSPHRQVMSKVFNRLLRWTGVIDDIGDTQCGFKLLDGDVARNLFAHLRTRGFAFDVEILWLARRFGFPVREVGVRWSDQGESSVRTLRDPVRMLCEIARFRWHHRRTRPSQVATNLYPRP